jgi:hypothetical protein
VKEHNVESWRAATSTAFAELDNPIAQLSNHT